ncbi:tyrosine--tRNA ligase [Candidatus Uhrbacteria bacterium]|nr:tyrosine--tRNA ligase [Candidatus Uhrbacteria bacterium]
MTIDEQVKALEYGTATIVPKNGLKEKLLLASKEKRPLRIKLGCDPTAPDLHLGHAVVLKKMRQFQELGHTIILIVGDFTTKIGDPTGRNKARPQLSDDEIKKNSATYLKQFSKVVDVKKVEIRKNSEWFGKMSAADFIKIIARHTLARILERDDFTNRFKQGVPINMHELVYPIVQGYDSVMVQADIEMGGTDQLFNCLVGRAAQETHGRRPQVVISMPLLRGLDGSDKMSKSAGNYVGLTEDANTMYAKIMSIPDELIEEYLDLASSFDQKECQELKKRIAKGENPMLVKKELACNITEHYHSTVLAKKAEEYFTTQVQNRSLESKEFEERFLESLKLPKKTIGLLDLCAALEKKRSKSMLRDLIREGAVSVNGEKLTNVHHIFSKLEIGMKIKIGKRGYYELV